METNVRHLPRLSLASAMRIYGLTARALRFYEERGLLSARRDRLNARYYDPEARQRLDWIARLRQGGVSLEDIRDILAAEDGDERRRELALAALARKQTELEDQLARIRTTRRALEGAADQRAAV
jgi:DNA-binding transcriptional MerR regulator